MERYTKQMKFVENVDKENGIFHLGARHPSYIMSAKIIKAISRSSVRAVNTRTENWANIKHSTANRLTVFEKYNNSAYAEFMCIVNTTHILAFIALISNLIDSLICA